MGALQLFKVTILVGLNRRVEVTRWVMTADAGNIFTQEAEHKLGGEVKTVEHLGDIIEV